MSEVTPPPGDNPPPPPPVGGTPPPPVYGQAPVPGMAPNGKQYAEWIWRVLAYVIDYIPVAILMSIGYMFAILLTSTSEVVRQGELYGTPYNYTTVESSTSAIGLLFAFVFYILGLAFMIWNKAYREGTTGKSIGKQVTGYTTVKEDTGEFLGFGMGFVRLLLLIVDFWICYVGVLWPLWDAKRQCLLSDKVTGAVVYKD